jgi:hypothetical protein
MSTRFCLPALVLLLAACSATSDKSPDVAPDQASSPDVTQPVDVPAVDVPPDPGRPDPQDIVPADVPDVFKTGISAKGYGEFCTSQADCAQYLLGCFSNGPEDVKPICSKTCKSNLECPEYYVCKHKTGMPADQNICMEAVFCSECQADVQCELPGMVCVDGQKEGSGRFCSYKCVPGALTCPAGANCIFSEAEEDWFCQPKYGACKGDGTQCSPCELQQDCAEGFHCFDTFYSDEIFCTKKCGEHVKCDAGWGCFQLEQGTTDGICLRIDKNGYAALTCFAGTQDICWECKRDLDCKEGLACYVGPDGIGFYCTPECKADEECPQGMKCTSSWDWGTGQIKGYNCAFKSGATCADWLKAQREE